MCDLAGKTICASLFGIIGLGLTCGAISSSIVWYSDIESAVGISPQNNAATTLSVSWQATLSNLCIQSGSYYNTGNGAVTITPTCFSYSPSSQAVNPNPNNDATISFLETNYLTEIQAGLNALQKAAGYTTAALGISIALIVIFLLCLGFLGLYKSRYPVSYVLCGFKCVGFLAWLSTLLAFVIYAGGIVKASSDFDVTLPGSTGAVALISSPGMSHTTGFGIAVGAHGLMMIACCIGLCVFPSEIIQRVDPDAIDPSTIGAVNGIPNIQIVVPGLNQAGNTAPTDANASFFVPNKAALPRNPMPQGRGPAFVAENPAITPNSRAQAAASRAKLAYNENQVRSPNSQSQRAYDESFYAQSPPAPQRGSPYR